MLGRDVLSGVVVMVEAFLEEEVGRSWRWLGHDGAWSELGAFHPGYVPGREYVERNRREGLFPRVWYARGADAVVDFVRRFAGSRLVCVSLNSRSGILRNRRGFARSAREDEVRVSQNVLLDFDFQGEVSDGRVRGFEGFLDRVVDAYFLDHGWQEPVRVETGGGFHVLVGYAPISLAECPDVAARLRVVREELEGEVRRDLSRLEVKLDDTQDVRRMWRLPGTGKPGRDGVSRFYGGERVEDEAFREYVVGLTVPEPRVAASALASVETSLPAGFLALLEQDEQLRQLWEGTGKPDGLDASRSGYEFSLVRRLLRLGYTDVAQLAVILSQRPDGSVRAGGKGDAYVRRTIANALVR